MCKNTSISIKTQNTNSILNLYLFILYHIYTLGSSDIYIYIFFLYRYLHMALLPVEETDISTKIYDNHIKFSAMLNAHKLWLKTQKKSGKWGKQQKRLHVAFTCYLVFLLQNMGKCSVAENGVIDPPRNHQAVYRQLTNTSKKLNKNTINAETLNWCFLRQGDKIQVIIVCIKYSHALAAVVTHSSIHFLIACLPCDM